MIPQTFPSKVDATTKKTIWLVDVLADVTGLNRWSDYIPIQYDVAIDSENSYGNNDAILIQQFNTGQAGKDFTKVYVEGTVRWTANENGYIPVQIFV